MIPVIPVTVSLMQGRVEGNVCVEALDGHIMVCSQGVEKTMRMVGIALETYFIKNPKELAKLAVNKGEPNDGTTATVHPPA